MVGYDAKHHDMVKRGSGGWNEWRHDPRTRFHGPNLNSAGLNRLDLSGADLRGADLEQANLSEANFTHSNLDRVERKLDLEKDQLNQKQIGFGNQISNLHWSGTL